MKTGNAEGSAPRKICQVTTIDMSLRYLLLPLMRYLMGKGYEVVGLSSAGPDVEALLKVGVRHIPVPMTRRLLTPLADIRALFRTVRAIRRERFDLVHTHTAKAGVLGRLAARLAGVPVVIHTNHGFVFHEGTRGLTRVLHIALERWACRWCDLVFSVNEEDLATAVRERICPAEKLVLLGRGGIGIDLARFTPDLQTAERRLTQRAELGFPFDAPVVGFVGRLVEEKGLLDLFQALRILRDAFPGLKALVVGPTDSAKRDVVRPEDAERYGVRACTCFTGQRHDTPDLYAVMDVLVLPSHREGFGLVLAEAAAMGVPVVASDIRGCREAVEAGRNGLLVPVRNPAALAEAIASLLRDRVLARRMGEEGRKVAAERFDERLVFEHVERHYERLLEAKNGR